jgi:4-amino-4-deoxy-L-arabinose transferase-like glycosyltransferase
MRDHLVIIVILAVISVGVGGSLVGDSFSVISSAVTSCSLAIFAHSLTFVISAAIISLLLVVAGLISRHYTESNRKKARAQGEERSLLYSGDYMYGTSEREEEYGFQQRPGADDKGDQSFCI